MFDFDAGKIIIVGVVALIFIPPKDLPRVLRQVGQFVGKMRRMASEFQGQFMDAMREADMADLKREAQKLSDAARVSTGLDKVHDLNSEMTGALERVGRSPETPAADLPLADLPLADAARATHPEHTPVAEIPAMNHSTEDEVGSAVAASAEPPSTIVPDVDPHQVDPHLVDPHHVDPHRDDAKAAVGHSA